MKSKFTFLLGGLFLAVTELASAQAGGLRLPKTVEAGSAVSIEIAGRGQAVLYIVGPGQVLRRDVELGETTIIAPGSLRNAGHYVAVLVGGSTTEDGAFDVIAARTPAVLSFLAKPSRLAVSLHDGISGVVYVFDAFQNLVLTPTPVSFQLSGDAGAVQTRTPKEGSAQFVARVGDTASTRVIQQVPGDPCHLRISARPAGQRLLVETDPVRDCSGNALSDGTIITFTETYNGGESTVDVPLKRGVARTDMPAYSGAKISVATGVFIGNEIRWGNGSGQ
jgi:hypothetical protein